GNSPVVHARWYPLSSLSIRSLARDPLCHWSGVRLVRIKHLVPKGPNPLLVEAFPLIGVLETTWGGGHSDQEKSSTVTTAHSSSSGSALCFALFSAASHSSRV